MHEHFEIINIDFVPMQILATLQGYYNSESGASSCSECAVGTFQSDEGQTTCMDCNMGTYNGLSGQAACHPCAAGKLVWWAIECSPVIKPPHYFCCAELST